MAANVEQLEEQLVKAVKIVEDQLDAELDTLEHMSSSELEKLRKQRLDQMKQQAAKKQDLLSKGHGEYAEITIEKELFDVTLKHSDNVVCHFYRDSTFRCKIVDKHLGLLAKQHIEARFVRINVEKAPFLCTRLNIKVLPCIAIVIKGAIKDYIKGFDDLGGRDDFSTEMLEWRLAQSRVIEYQGDLFTPPDQVKKQVQTTRKTIRGTAKDSDSDED